MRKKKSKITHEQLVAEGIVFVPDDCKPTAKVDDPVKPTADVVTPRPTPTNLAPRVTDARRMPPTATGLQRAINANIEAQGSHVATAPENSNAVTGLQRAINANISKTKTQNQ